MTDAQEVTHWRRRLRPAVLVLLWIGLLAGPLWARVGWESAAALAAAQEAAAAGDPDLEIERLGLAARMRAPLLPWDDRALDRLLARARQERERGSAGQGPSLRAYREVRRALISTRVFAMPRPDDFQEANENIARMMAQQERAFGTDLSGAGDQEAYHLALLQELPGPSPWRAILASAFFVIFAGCGIGFIVRALDAHGRVRARAAIRWGGSCLLALIVWVWLTRLAG